MAPRNQEPWYAFAAVVLRPLMSAAARREWTHVERLPTEGGIVVVPNHLSHIDPLVVAHYLYDNGRLPRFLAKATLFDVFFVRRVLRGARQIPVYRESRVAGDAYRDAVEAVLAGECVVVYAEGTLTRDPRLWPMEGKTGAARIALATGRPVLPMATWGPQDLLAPYGRWLHVWPRPLMKVTLGEPVDLSDLLDEPETPAVLRVATERIMDAVTAQVAELRGEPAPEQRLDLRGTDLAATGNAHVAYELDRRPRRRLRPGARGHGQRRVS
ncbi:MAG: lysophospholipid acyltransferase family protein [Actinomycetes bacterium]